MTRRKVYCLQNRILAASITFVCVCALIGTAAGFTPRQEQSEFKQIKAPGDVDLYIVQCVTQAIEVDTHVETPASDADYSLNGCPLFPLPFFRLLIFFLFHGI